MEPESPDSAGPASDEQALRELSKLAEASKIAPRTPSSERSGFVDLAAIMAEPPSARDGGGRISSESLAPPSLASFASIAPTTNEALGARPPGRARGAELPLILGILGAGVFVAGVSVFALRAAPSAASPQAAVVAASPAVAALPLAPVAAAVVAASPAVAAPPPAPVAAAVVAASPAIAPAPPPETTPATPAEAPPLARDHATATPLTARTHGGTASHPAPAHTLVAALRGASDATPATPAPAAVEPAPARAPKVAPQAASDGLPERPSGSAVTSALSGLLPAARACVAGMAAPSRALVTFSGDGAVLKIEITGPAAGNPKASQCVRGAFGRAHIPAFSQSVYSAGVTVRPE